MIFCKNVRPSMRGISISSRITSGTSSSIRSAATKGSLAVPITSMAGSSDSTSLRVWRTTAESSTMRTRIFGWLIAYTSERRSPQPLTPGCQPVQQHFTRPGVEVNSPAADAAQVGSGHREAFLRQDLHGGLAILGSHRGARGKGPIDGQNIGASEQLDRKSTRLNSSHL